MKKITNIRKSVCIMANELKKAGYTLSQAFKKAWRRVKLQMVIRVAGTTFENRQERLQFLSHFRPQDLTVSLERERNNVFDVNAIKVLLHISLKQLEQLKKDIQMGQIQSLDGFVLQEDDGITIADLVSAADDVEETVIDRVQKEQLKEVLWEIVDDLGEDQANVIRARYQEKRTLKDIAEKNKCAIEWVRQTEKKAMKRLRIPSRANKLKPFYDGVIFDQALKGNGVARFNTTWTSSTERIALEML